MVLEPVGRVWIRVQSAGSHTRPHRAPVARSTSGGSRSCRSPCPTARSGSAAVRDRLRTRRGPLLDVGRNLDRLARGPAVFGQRHRVALAQAACAKPAEACVEVVRRPPMPAVRARAARWPAGARRVPRASTRSASVLTPSRPLGCPADRSGHRGTLKAVMIFEVNPHVEGDAETEDVVTRRRSRGSALRSHSCCELDGQ